MQKGDVVGFQKRVPSDFPIGLQGGRPRPAGSCPVGKRITAAIVSKLAQVVVQRFLGGWLKVNKNKPGPYIDSDWS